MKYSIKDLKVLNRFNDSIVEVELESEVDYSNVDFTSENPVIPQAEKIYVSVGMLFDGDFAQFMTSKKSVIEMVSGDNEIEEAYIIDQFDSEEEFKLSRKSIDELCGKSKYIKAYQYVGKILRDLSKRSFEIDG